MAREVARRSRGEAHDVRAAGRGARSLNRARSRPISRSVGRRNTPIRIDARRSSASASLAVAVTAVIAVTVAVAAALTADDLGDALSAVVLVAALAPIVVTDLERRAIPNRLTATGSVAALAIGAVADPGGLPAQVGAAVAAGGLLLLAALARPDGMGMGDVKLAAMLGLFLGDEVAVALLAAFLAGALFGAAVVVRRGLAAGRAVTFPFGPFLALGAVVALLAGAPLLDWYLG
jgi:leader peptidase (prepilin peptidase)/N-methyltransferase